MRPAVKNDTSVPSPSFNALVMDALKGGDKTFTQPIRKHWETLEKPETIEFLGDGTHIAHQEFSRDHMVAMLGHQRQSLAQALQEAHDIPSLQRSCVAFIDREIKTLFFVTNDENQAQLGRDYFHTFLDGLVARLDKTDPRKKELKALCLDLKDYYGISLQSYQTLGDHIEYLSSQGDPSHPDTTRSIVECALLADVKTPHDEETATALLADKKAVFDPAAYSRLQQATSAFYSGLMQHQYNFLSEDITPMDTWLNQRIVDILQEKHRETLLQLPDGEAERQAMLETLDLEHKGILSSLRDSVKHLDNPQRTIAMAVQLDALQAQTARLPLDFPVTLGEIGRYAMQDAFKHLPLLVGEYAMEAGQRPVPLANQRQKNARATFASLSELNIPNMALTAAPTKEELDDHAEWTEQNLRRLMEVFQDGFSRSRSMEDILAKEKTFLNQLANTVYMGPLSPSSLLFAKRYFKSVRTHLEFNLDETGHREPHEATLKSLAHIEEKCDMLYKGFFVTGDWLMEHTDGAHDRAVLPAFLQTAAQSGRTWGQLGLHAQNAVIGPLAAQLLTEMMQDKGIKKEVFHPLIPYVFENCVDIAAREEELCRQKNALRKAQPEIIEGGFTQKLADAQPLSYAIGDATESSLKDRAHALFEQAMGMAGDPDAFSPLHCVRMQEFLRRERIKAQAWTGASKEDTAYSGRH